MIGEIISATVALLVDYHNAAIPDCVAAVAGSLSLRSCTWCPAAVYTYNRNLFGTLRV
jgi:hypothetical protein